MLLKWFLIVSIFKFCSTQLHFDYDKPSDRPAYPANCCPLYWQKISQGQKLPDKFVNIGEYFNFRGWAFAKIGRWGVGVKSYKESDKLDYFPSEICKVPSCRAKVSFSSYLVLVNPRRCVVGWMTPNSGGQEFHNSNDKFFPSLQSNGTQGYFARMSYDQAPSVVRWGEICSVDRRMRNGSQCNQLINERNNYEVMYVDCEKSVESMFDTVSQRIVLDGGDMNRLLSSSRTKEVLLGEVENDSVSRRKGALYGSDLPQSEYAMIKESENVVFTKKLSRDWSFVRPKLPEGTNFRFMRRSMTVVGEQFGFVPESVGSDGMNRIMRESPVTLEPYTKKILIGSQKIIDGEVRFVAIHEVKPVETNFIPAKEALDTLAAMLKERTNSVEVLSKTILIKYRGKLDIHKSYETGFSVSEQKLDTPNGRKYWGCVENGGTKQQCLKSIG